ncbi:MAG: F0F1 ATP synthase subunit delta [Saprospiraceae bacterium]|nr:F0F1 ATP synthase subunit delta [Saprospiraceae bacterium]
MSIAKITVSSKLKVTTAEATTPDINAQISKKLGELLPGKTIEISSIINPAIIGGFILEYNQQEYNASIAYTLDKMRKTFKA